MIWYWRTKPPTLATSATPGTALSWYLRNQSWMDRSSLRSWRSDRSAYWNAQPTPVASGPSVGVTSAGSRVDAWLSDSSTRLRAQYRSVPSSNRT